MNYSLTSRRGYIIIKLDGSQEHKYFFQNTISVEVILNDAKEFNEFSLSNQICFNKEAVRDNENNEINFSLLPPSTVDKVKKEDLNGLDDHVWTDSAGAMTMQLSCDPEPNEEAPDSSPTQKRKSHDKLKTLTTRSSKRKRVPKASKSKKKRKTEIDSIQHDPFQCDLCGFKAKSEKGLRVHQSAHQRKLNISTDGEDGESEEQRDGPVMTFSSTNSTNSKTRKYRICDICNKEFSSIPFLKQHKHKVHGEKHQYRCPQCQASFKSLKELRQHKRNHPNQRRKLYQCNFCDQTFDLIADLISHKSSHGLYCEICKETFSLVGQLNMHLKEKHINDVDEKGEKMVKSCTMCSRVYLSEKKLMKHMTIHSDSKAYVCFKCGKMFSWKRTLVLHDIRFHSEPESQPRNKCICSMCGKEFPFINSLTHHMIRVHSEKAYKCNQCPKSFINTHKLQVHMRTHTREQPYQCDVCQRRFTQSYNLTVHMRTHTKEKPFVCAVCGLPFAHKCSMQGHMRAKHSMAESGSMRELQQQMEVGL